MEKKSKELFELLDSAYNDPEIKNDVLLKIILDAAGSLEKEEKYEDVVQKLSRNISSNYRNLPEKLTSIYKFIQADVKPLKLNSKELRDKAIADGAMSTILF
ncbi:bacteriocin immunity protein [Pseudolactococcus carnosus]|uniref:bacteriocin immunity protein n=1 Tax=Pseudolactococcus carnosus TaxID=2749961 RepID=UPI000BD4F989|nr:bacteriocin immunity protein [Lactococcus carnosus]SOB47670.1 putative carnobacteriocin-B2 immunity protein [Lactococcus piscium]MCJ1968235.1 bacteriocin immunity protein [Lactococcus carnosus]MCJ1981245.1 bacteriocin immunity protein [Lactococcus carnosus]MCJ1988273.1 bacteriocin immunity protein [Lactococcus carnosus]MCJ2000637.1 bacteriocin immunity protein [Lactococcus carnosus]